MLEDKIKKRLTDRLKDSHLSKIIAEEMAALCSEKPGSMTIESFGSIVAQVILHELHNRLVDACDDQERLRSLADVLHHPISSTQPTLDFEAILNGLLTGMEHDILLGNLQMIRALGGAVAMRDTGTSEHNLRVTLYSSRLATSVGLNSDEMQALLKGSFLHDIGKIGIADDILLNPGKLTPAESAVMRSHATLGCDIIAGVRWLEDAQAVVRHHHEHYDGTGYPDGIAGETIPLAARIFGIADVFDALTSRRMYKDPMSYDAAREVMIAERGKHFDPKLLDRFWTVAPEVYREISTMSVDELEAMILKLITRLFGVNPMTTYRATDKYRQPTDKK
jgi:putative nucleotidyltransferase with HDIG domain